MKNVKYILTLVLLVSQTSLCAQSKKTIDAEHLRIFRMSDEKYDSVFLLLDRTHFLAKEENYRRGRLTSEALRGYFLSSWRNDSSAIVTLLEVYPYINEIDELYHPIINWSLGRSFFRSGLPDRGNYYFEQNISTTYDSIELQLEILVDWGSHLAKKNRYVQALEIYEEAYELTLSESKMSYQSDLYRYLSNVYNRMADFEHAKEYARKSINFYKLNKNERKLADGYLTYAGILVEEEQFDSSIFYYKKSLLHYENANDLLGPVYSYVNMSNSYLAKQDYDSCLFFLKKSKHGLSLLDGDRRRLSEAIDMQFITFYQETKKYDDAYAFAISTLKNTKNTGVLETMRNAYRILYHIKKIKNQPDSALYYHELYKQYADSIFNDRSERQYTRQRFAIETLEKTHEINILKKEVNVQELRNGILTAGIFGILVIVFLIVGFYRSLAKNARLKSESMKEQLKAKERELSDFTLTMIQKNRFMEEHIEQLNKVKSQLPMEHSGLIGRLMKAIKLNKSSEKDWDNFNKYFGSVHRDFFEKVKKKYHLLSPSDLRHAALVKMNLSLKEASEILGVDTESVKKARYRMRKKMNLDSDTKLHSAINLI